MGDDIGGVKKMGAGNRQHSVALVLLASTLMMLVATSNCSMSTTTTTTAGNSTAASSAWCDGHIVDGQCILMAQSYGGGEHLEYLDLDVMDRMVVEYDDSGETSSRRVLDGVPKGNIHDVTRNRGPICHDTDRPFTCLGPPNNNGCHKRGVYDRSCSQ